MKLSAVAGDSDDAVNKATEESRCTAPLQRRAGGAALSQ